MPREGTMPIDLQDRLAGERTLMRIYVGEGDRYDGEPLFRAIVDLLRQRGLAGATVMQCIMGFGATRSLHSYMSDVPALDLPVVIECVDSEERIQAVLPALDDMIGAGLITLERAKVIAYRAQYAGQTPGEA
jgi:PII-like signaling protein